MENSRDYCNMVEALRKPGIDILKDLDPDKANLWHLGTGVCGEAGELLDAIKKCVIYNTTIDLKNLIEELGDLEFYLEGIRQSLNLNREEILKANMEKLSTRYESGTYSNDSAQLRKDKDEE